MDHLSEAQKEAVLLFEEISQLDDHQLSIQILSQTGWNVDVAVDNFIQGRTVVDQNTDGSSNRIASSANRSQSIINNVNGLQ